MTNSATRVRGLAANCERCGRADHLLSECRAYSSHMRGRVALPTQLYAHDPGCISLNEAANFVHLLSTIRQHLYCSTDTQQYYVRIAQEFYYKLLEGGCHDIDHQPCKDDFISFVVNYWPTFRSIEGPTTEVLWGMVSKQIGSPHEVGISNSLVSAAEIANSRPGSNLPLYNLLLAVVILHELSHAFTKYLFNNIITPNGVGPALGKYGESGWLLETRLMQGLVFASWDDEYEVGQMKLIKRVVLEMNSKLVYIIDVGTAEKILQSLASSHLTPPSAYLLAKSPGGDFCARVTDITPLPTREAVPVGLGFCSYVGSDRWKTPW